jgi:uncharacterized protein
MNVEVPVGHEKASISNLKEIDFNTDSRDILAHARRDLFRTKFKDAVIFDMDAHHYEQVSWREVVEYIDDPVLREHAREYGITRPFAPFGQPIQQGLHFQDVAGRIPHQTGLREKIESKEIHRDVVLIRRAMAGMGIDYTVIFPTAMLMLGLSIQVEMEVQLGNAYNRWLIEKVLPGEPRMRGLVYLPFNSPEAACRTVEQFADAPGIIGFCVTSVRHKPVQDNAYMRMYRMIEESGKPIVFHAAYHWEDISLATMQTFLGVHALGFVWCNMVHLTNWILHGIPERFPRLKSIWVESGLAWIPFLMQRLDDQYMFRQSEAPLLKRMPSEYMRDNCWYSSQPMETSNKKALELTMEMIKAETQLLYASDWPHFDFDTPSSIINLPFLSDQAKRNILGLNAAKVFGIELRKQEAPQEKLMA